MPDLNTSICSKTMIYSEPLASDLHCLPINHTQILDHRSSNNLIHHKEELSNDRENPETQSLRPKLMKMVATKQTTEYWIGLKRLLRVFASWDTSAYDWGGGCGVWLTGRLRLFGWPSSSHGRGSLAAGDRNRKDQLFVIYGSTILFNSYTPGACVTRAVSSNFIHWSMSSKCI